MWMEAGVPGSDLRILGVIPARYKSSRFPGKPLVSICGIPMLKRTYLQAIKSGRLNKLIVATDDSRIFEFCESENIPVVYTSEDCLTGTDRLAEVANQYVYSEYDLYVNIQGDEPIIDPEAINQLCQQYEEYGDSYSVYNLYKIIADEDEINSDTIIKVIVNELDEAMYMSRLPVPYSKSNNKPVYRQQIPVYAFTRPALELFSSHSKTINEQHEDIELLRFVDLRYKIKMTETFVVSIAVDVPEDIEKIERQLELMA